MLFNSTQFIIFFPIVVCLYFVLPARVRNYWLLICSYYFYMCWNPKYILLLMASTLVTYASGLCIERAGRLGTKRLVVAVSVVANVGLLFYFKYINFALDVLTQIFGRLGVQLSVPQLDIVLPVGISFYIFQALGYTIDVYRGQVKAERNVFTYALFVSFFPQLVAGPIERSGNLLRQLKQPAYFNYDRVRAGLLTMLWGYFLKLVIADRCGVLVDTIYGSLADYTGWYLIFANVMFAVQIYCDFMSYSTIARGAAQVLGFGLMDNFEMPYFATSIREFWHRWHISLSTWLRDYVYIPLGGSRCSKARKYLNIMITFFVSGLWHGASFTYIVWGLLHGAYQVVEDLLDPAFGDLLKRFKLKRDSRLVQIPAILVTFIFTDLAWVFFRASTVREALWVIGHSFIPAGLDTIRTGILTLGLEDWDLQLLAIGLVVLFVSSLMRAAHIDLRTLVSNWRAVPRYAIYWMAVLMIVFSLNVAGQEFIYFQF